MIGEALRVLVFGMLGIFLVMAIIFAVIVGLTALSKRFFRDDGATPDAGAVDQGASADNVEVVTVTELVEVAPGADPSAEVNEFYDDGEFMTEEYFDDSYGDEYLTAGEYWVQQPEEFETELV